MRRLVALGAFSLAGALIGACGDDDPGTGAGGRGGGAGRGGSAGANNAGAAGSGGINGNGGTAGINGNGGTGGGNAGTGGGSSGTGGGSSGTGGTGGSDVDPDAGTDAGPVGNLDGCSVSLTQPGGGVIQSGDGPACTGFLEVRSPFVPGDPDGGTPSGNSFFQLSFSSRDLSDTVATFRVRTAVLGEDLFVQTFATDADFAPFGAGTFRSINAANFTDTETFIDIPVDVGAIVTAGFDTAAVIAVGFQVGPGGSFDGEGNSVLILDSITFTGSSGLTDLDFTGSAQGFAVSRFTGSNQENEVVHHP